jgi:hypothetical protein
MRCHKYRDLTLLVGGLGARLTTLLCKKNYCCDNQGSENGTIINIIIIIIIIIIIKIL